VITTKQVDPDASLCAPLQSALVHVTEVIVVGLHLQCPQPTLRPNGLRRRARRALFD